MAARIQQLRPDEVRQLAQIYGVPPALALSIWQQESSAGKNAATSSKGARGGFQVMPATFQQYNPGGNIDDPTDNAVAGLRYLRDLMDRYGDPELAAQAYYGGRPVGVRGKQDVTSGPGTPTISQYGQQVVQRMAQFEPQYDAQMLPTLPAYDARPEAGLMAMNQDALSPADSSNGYPLLMHTPTLAEMSQSIPQQPQQDPLQALMAKMYGATDPETGAPMDVAFGLRDPTDRSSNDMDSYVRNMVTNTLNGMNFG